MNNSAHYCTEHNSKFYKNEKVNALGQTDVWYSHKIKDGSGFCTEKKTDLEAPKNGVKLTEVSTFPKSMYACNAMNNAVLLACHGKISLDQVPLQYKKILGGLVQLG